MTPYWETGNGKLYQGDVLEVLRALPAASFQCCVTSPPYWGLKNYGVDGQLGLEASPQEYVAKMVEVFREVARVLRPDAVCFLNVGDSYAGSGGPRGDYNEGGLREGQPKAPKNNSGIRAKSLCLIPERLAIALQADGWIIRSRICWAKMACMPESVRDRPTCAWEHIWMMTRQGKYYYDPEAVQQPASQSFANDRRWKTGGTATNEKDGYEEAGAQNPKGPHRMFGYARPNGPTQSPHGQGFTRENKQDGHGRRHAGFNERFFGEPQPISANLRNFWLLGPEPFPEAHFATFPTEIPRRCIRASTSEKGACPECGSPWERVVEREANYEKRQDRGQVDDQPPMVDSTGWRPATVTESGWRPTCSCGREDTVPCAVLDPFMGSGTTAAVATELDRRWAGIELSPEYCEIAKRRIQAVGAPQTRMAL